MEDSEMTTMMTTSQPDPALKQLEILVGTWKLTGYTFPARVENITGWMKVEWILGRHFLKITHELTMQGERMPSIEIITYDPENKTFPSIVYSSMPGSVRTYKWKLQGNTMLHFGEGATYMGRLSENGKILIGGWQPDEGVKAVLGNTYNVTMIRMDQEQGI